MDHNLPAQGDIASFSPQWSGLYFSTKRKQQLSDPCDCCIKKKKKCEGGKHCQGTNYSFKNQSHRQADVENALIKGIKKKNKIMNLDFN